MISAGITISANSDGIHYSSRIELAKQTYRKGFVREWTTKKMPDFLSTAVKTKGLIGNKVFRMYRLSWALTWLSSKKIHS